MTQLYYALLEDIKRRENESAKTHPLPEPDFSRSL